MRSIAPGHLEEVAPASALFRRPEVEIDTDCARIARQLRHSARQTVGLLPASDKTDTRPLLYQLALALAKICRSDIVIVDPGGRWPIEGDRQIQDDFADDEPVFFKTRFIEPGVSLVAPREQPPPGARVQLLKLVLDHVARSEHQYAMRLIDLTGYEWPGEFLYTLDLLEGVVVVGRSGAVREDDLWRTSRQVPDELNLGVVVTA